jgi:hypothetical protein
VEVQLHAFLTSALDTDGQVHNQAGLPPLKKSTVLSEYEAEWVKVDVADLANRGKNKKQIKKASSRKKKDFSVLQPVA